MLNYVTKTTKEKEVIHTGKYYVYMHVNKINQKKYIGVTKQDKPEYRWGINGVNYQESPHFYAAIQKYGWDNFDHIVLAEGLSKEEACQMEIKLIAQYNTQDKEYGYNILAGGTAPSIPQETRDKIAKGLIGNKNGFGKPCSEEKKKKISDAQKGRKFSEERKQSLRKPKSVTYPCTPEKRQNIINAKQDKKSIVCIETGEIFESIRACARDMGLHASTICAVVRGRKKSTGGYHFKYSDI